jgi:hypothetical protein
MIYHGKISSTVKLGWRTRAQRRTARTMEPNHCGRQYTARAAGFPVIYETRTRSLVKTVIYRVWVLITTYAMLLITGQSLESAIVPTLIINAVWMTSFYLYDRIWASIAWGRIHK